jgi:hypothetical protein
VSRAQASSSGSGCARRASSPPRQDWRGASCEKRRERFSESRRPYACVGSGRSVPVELRRSPSPRACRCKRASARAVFRRATPAGPAGRKARRTGTRARSSKRCSRPERVGDEKAMDAATAAAKAAATRTGNSTSPGPDEQKFRATRASMRLAVGFFLVGQQRINPPRLQTQFAQPSGDLFHRVIRVLDLHLGLLLRRHHTSEHRASDLRVL